MKRILSILMIAVMAFTGGFVSVFADVTVTAKKTLKLDFLN